MSAVDFHKLGFDLLLLFFGDEYVEGAVVAVWLLTSCPNRPFNPSSLTCFPSPHSHPNHTERILEVAKTNVPIHMPNKNTVRLTNDHHASGCGFVFGEWDWLLLFLFFWLTSSLDRRRLSMTPFPPSPLICRGGRRDGGGGSSGQGGGSTSGGGRGGRRQKEDNPCCS